MTSLHNRYFHQSKTNEQALINGLAKETIQLFGHMYYYLPRDVQIADLILGEDILSKFSLAIPIEMYLVDTVGFQGDREMFSKFGLEVKNSYKLVVSVDRWEEEIKSQFDNESWNGEADFDIANYVRPHEGDLIYDPITKFLMVSKFVDHDVEFFALEKNYQYYLTCEAFQYQQEVIATGIDAIDSLGLLESRNAFDYQILLENGNHLIYENSDWAILDYVTAATRLMETMYSDEALSIDYSVVDPFRI